jgi:hypothetical protein
MVRDGALAAGSHAVELVLHDDAGRPLPSGLYLVRLESGGDATSRRFLVVR